MSFFKRVINLQRYCRPSGLEQFARVALYRIEDASHRWWTAYLRLLGHFLCIRIGRHTVIQRGVVLSTKHGGSIRIGEHCELKSGARVLSHGGDIYIDDFCSINPGCVLYGHGGLQLGRGVKIAAHTVIIPANHDFVDPQFAIHEQSESKVGITIGADVWIGTHCVILDGVRVADRCVIAAGAVVNRSTEKEGIYAGVPARRVKERFA